MNLQNLPNLAALSPACKLYKQPQDHQQKRKFCRHRLLISFVPLVHLDNIQSLYLLSVSAIQYEILLNFAKICPENNYARKNIGYLYAIKNGAKLIFETDDDNKFRTDSSADNTSLAQCLERIQTRLELLDSFLIEDIKNPNPDNN